MANNNITINIDNLLKLTLTVYVATYYLDIMYRVFWLHLTQGVYLLHADSKLCNAKYSSIHHVKGVFHKKCPRHRKFTLRTNCYLLDEL